MKDLSFLKSTRIAHRGIFDNKIVYENTLDAFRRALKYNFIIEVDIRMLCDGTLIAFHDEDLKRLLHLDDKCEKFTYDELSYISKFHIPTLSEVLNLVNGAVPLIIELKTKTKRGILEKKVSEYLDSYNGLYAIQSFNISTLKWYYKNRKDVPIGYLICKKNYKKEYFFRKYDFIDVNILLYSSKRIKKLREEKMVLGYVIKNQEEYDTYKSLYDNLVFDNILEIKN